MLDDETEERLEIEGTRKSPNATVEQAANYLHLSKRMVQEYQARGLLKPVYFGKRRFFRWADIERLAKSGVR
jgi:hypothetical protein